MKPIHQILAAITVTFVGVTAQAQITLTFDDLNGTPVNNSGQVNGQLIATAYNGFNFGGFQSIDGAGAQSLGAPASPNGLSNAVASANNVAYAYLGSVGTIQSNDTQIIFGLYNSWITSAYADGLQLSVTGYYNSSMVATTTITLNTTKQQFTFATNGSSPWALLDQVVFQPVGGTGTAHAGYTFDANHHYQYALDNVQLAPTPVPEPATWAGIGAALGGLIFVARSARRKSEGDQSETDQA